MALTTDQKNVLRAYNQAQPDPIASGEANSALTDVQAEVLINGFLTACIQASNAKIQNLPHVIASLTAQVASLNSQLASAESVLASAKAIQAANIIPAA